MLIFKARRKDPTISHALTASERRVMKILGAAMQKVRAGTAANEDQIIDALRHLPVGKIVDLVPDQPWFDAQGEIEDELVKELVASGQRTGSSFPKIRKEVLTYRFDADRPEAAAWAKKESAKLVTEIIEDQRNTIRDFVSASQMGDFTVTQVARNVRDIVGLTTQQTGWVENFRNRAISDRMALGDSFEQASARAAKETERYQQRIHRYRSETIARTEILRASSEGRNQAWQQGLADGYIDPDSQKQWVAEFDACEICSPLDGETVGISAEFPDGDPPLHPNCRCSLDLVDIDVSDFEDMSWEEIDAELDSLFGEQEESVLQGMGYGTTIGDDEFAEMSRMSGEDYIIGRDENGVPIFNEERQALHDKIIADKLEGFEGSENPTYTMLGGGPASGKTTSLGSFAGDDNPNVLKIDPDAIKTMLPEYKKMVEANDPNAAAFVHEESSYIAKRLQKASFERGVDVLLDGTGNGSEAGLVSKIQAAQASGYRVRAFYATITVDEALERSEARFQRTGRKVPEEKIRITHGNVSRVFPAAANLADEISLYDTTERTPRLIMEGERGIIRVLDEGGYEAFLRKADQ